MMFLINTTTGALAKIVRHTAPDEVQIDFFGGRDVRTAKIPTSRLKDYVDAPPIGSSVRHQLFPNDVAEVLGYNLKGSYALIQYRGSGEKKAVGAIELLNEWQVMQESSRNVNSTESKYADDEEDIGAMTQRWTASLYP